MAPVMTERILWGVYDDTIAKTSPWISSFLILGERQHSPQARVSMSSPLLGTLQSEWKRVQLQDSRGAPQVHPRLEPYTERVPLNHDQRHFGLV